ncbi:MAG TPA: beta-galactosidase GalA [Bryobacteraceae bacterium]|jgi:beta-galactosidase|nr:beta-galactosidase GalA [Bryobacteraceae bacterium]
MSNLSRRELFKTGIAASAVVAEQTSAPAQSQQPAPPARERLLFDSGWRFHLGNADDSTQDFDWGAGGGTFAKSGTTVPAAKPNFDDSSWRALDLPHDWAVELPFVNDKSITDHGSHPLGRQFPATSIGWYRRVFDLPASDLGRRIALEFDGVYRDSVVIVNGHYIGRNFSGYAPFRYDISDQANYGARNVILVRVDATLGDGWFYEGAGIYRHVWLTKTNAVHVPQWGTFVRSTVRPGGPATLRVTVEVDNETAAPKNCSVTTRVLDPAGRGIATLTATPVAISAWGRHAFDQSADVRSPALWSVEDPKLYRLETTVESAGATVDTYITPFGIRSVRFDVNNGFFLNEKPVKLKGTCNHQDHAGVGAALPDRIQYYRIERLKDMQSNALRTSHNPPTPELMDACDQLGMMVMCETRMMDSTPEGLSQLERMVRCHRNHPSIVIWSVGNEEPEQGTERGARIEATMKRTVQAHDDSRLITQAMNYGWGGKGATKVQDVQGFNYNEGQIDRFHKDWPALPMVGTETASTVSTRGIYFNDKEKGYVRAYDLERPPWAALAEVWWKFYDARPFLAGGFAWTGFDYRGEPTPYGWPCINSHFGIMDMCGFPKDNFYYYQAWWGTKPVLHLFPHWNWEGKEGQEIEVWVHSNLDRVELFLNGASQGAQDVKRNTHLEWQVKYAPGAIEARGFRGGKQVLTVKRETTGPAAKIVLRADRPRVLANGEDVAMITAVIQDAQGREVATADHPLTFRVAGGGKLIGLGNGDPSCHESDKSDSRRAFNGLCMAMVQTLKTADEIRVEATSPGLLSAALSVSSVAVALRPSVP